MSKRSNGKQIAMWLSNPIAIARINGIEDKTNYVERLIVNDALEQNEILEVHEETPEDPHKVLAMFHSLDLCHEYIISETCKRTTGKLSIVAHVIDDNSMLIGGKQV